MLLSLTVLHHIGPIWISPFFESLFPPVSQLLTLICSCSAVTSLEAINPGVPQTIQGMDSSVWTCSKFNSEAKSSATENSWQILPWTCQQRRVSTTAISVSATVWYWQECFPDTGSHAYVSIKKLVNDCSEVWLSGLLQKLKQQSSVEKKANFLQQPKFLLFLLLSLRLGYPGLTWISCRGMAENFRCSTSDTGSGAFHQDEGQLRACSRWLSLGKCCCKERQGRESW